jgi:DNA-binding NarL/FixJ family response regulator
MRIVSPTVKNPIRVLMLEASEVDATHILQELRQSSLPTVIDRVDSAEAFASAVRSFAPDVVLSDHSMPELDAGAALTLLRTIRPATPMILLTASINPEATVAFLRAGVDDVMMKGDLSRLPEAIADAVQLRRPLDKLTPRQVEVLRLVADGHRTSAIAARLKLSVKTVESHRSEIMRRLGIHDVVGLARYAIRIGLTILTFDNPEMSGEGRSQSIEAKS